MQKLLSKEEQYWTIGQTVFNKKIHDSTLPLPNQNTIRIFSSKSWSFCLNDQWTAILTSIQRSQCEWFRPGIIRNSIPSIICLISHISFTSLTQLDLGNARLTTVEGLAFLDIENIQKLKLLTNDITCIKVINKTHWKQLENFVVSGYHINSTDLDINRAKMTKVFRNLAFNHSPSSIFIENYNSLMKMEANQVLLLNFSFSPKLIFSKKLAQKINERFQTEKIIWANHILQF